MPKIMCDAITCKFNKGNADFVKGSFECEANEIVTFENTEDCDCGVFRDEIYCKSYVRRIKGEWA